MSRDLSARAMRAALKRLEKAVGKGQRHCPWCQLNFRHGWPDPKLPRPGPEDLVKYRCEICGTEMFFNLSHLSEEERELRRLSYSFTMEDAYTNPAAVALERWLSIHPERRDAGGLRKSAAEMDGRDPGARALAKLREEEERLLERKRRRLVARHGDPTSEVNGVSASVRDRVRDKWQAHFGIRGLPELVREQATYLICAELERIIWARVRPDTAVAIEELEQRIVRLVEDERARTEAGKKRHGVRGRERKRRGSSKWPGRRRRDP